MNDFAEMNSTNKNMEERIEVCHLESDYNNGAHEAVLRHLIETNNERSQSYGDERFSERARQLIGQACEAPEAQVWFLAGGTQTNATIIDCVLQPYEGVLCPETAHINVHESGAVEFTGHKVIALPSHDGKLDVGELRSWLSAFFADETAEHMVRPGMVYITFPTELGTLYTAAELTALHDVCQKYGLKLYVDGARLAYGLAASPDVTLPLLSRLADIFYIGGTKCGALCGEAVVFPRGDAPSHMLSRIKRHGALLAKGWVAALQFDTLLDGDSLTDTPYYNICSHAIREAMRLKQALLAKGYTQPVDSPTNQQFIKISLQQAEELKQHITYGEWEPPRGDKVTIRLATSWATNPEDVDKLIELL